MATYFIENTRNPVRNNLSWKALCQTKAIKVPFQLALSNQDGVVVCEEIIRFVPKKRLVAFGRWDNQDVVIKLFFKKREAKRHFEREVIGVDALIQANVPTPQLLFKGPIEKKRIYALIFEKIKDVKSIETLWQEKQSVTELMPMLHAAVIELATQHVLGILQRDLHLKNFLVTDKIIYTLDGGQITKFEKPLNKKISMEYLALFLVQFGAGTTGLQQELFNMYTRSRGWLLSAADIQFFKKMLIKHNTLRGEHFHKKVFRNCTAFKKIKKFNKNIMLDRAYESDELSHFLQAPEYFINHSTALLLKKGRSTTVARVQIGEHLCVVKRYNIKNFWHWLRRCFRPSRASKSWMMGRYMYEWGIATAKPIGFIEQNILGFRGKSYLIMEYINDCHIGRYFSTYHPEDRQYITMAKKVLALFFQLAELNITHGDLKKTNILINEQGPVLIDLDGVKVHQFSWSLRLALELELKRFMKNWKEQQDIYTLFANLLTQEVLEVA